MISKTGAKLPRMRVSETTAEQHCCPLSKNPCAIAPSAPMIWDLYRAQKSTGLATARKHPETYFP
jgi:hypothetical protein